MDKRVVLYIICHIINVHIIKLDTIAVVIIAICYKNIFKHRFVMLP